LVFVTKFNDHERTVWPVVDALPPLTDWQRASLAVLFAPYVKKPDSLTPRARARRRSA
jgi:hypothetical protein